MGLLSSCATERTGAQTLLILRVHHTTRCKSIITHRRMYVPFVVADFGLGRQLLQQQRRLPEVPEGRQHPYAKRRISIFYELAPASSRTSRSRTKMGQGQRWEEIICVPVDVRGPPPLHGYTTLCSFNDTHPHDSCLRYPCACHSEQLHATFRLLYRNKLSSIRTPATFSTQ